MAIGPFCPVLSTPRKSHGLRESVTVRNVGEPWYSAAVALKLEMP